MTRPPDGACACCESSRPRGTAPCSIARQFGWPVVLPHPGMLPSGPSIASPECSRRHVSLSIDFTGPAAPRGVTQTGFPVRSATLLSHPDLALPKPQRAAEGDCDEPSRPDVESGSRHPRMGQLLLPLPCLEALPPAGRVDNPKALVASRQAVAERGLEDLSNQAASGGVRVG
jgi:hypothetical protein